MNKTFADFVELDEGINDPGIFKAVFLAGGPGSGKSFIAGKAALTVFGLKLVNSDIAFEIALKKAGLEASPENIFTTKGQSLRDRAKKLTKMRQTGYIDGRIGLIIDGTGKDYNKIAGQKKGLEELGYDCAMIFVNTSETTAQDRNLDRERTMPQAQVSKMWQRVQNNIGKFQNLFGAGTFHVVDNNTDSNYKGAVLDVYRKIGAWTKTPPRNYKAARWIKAQKLTRSNETKSRLRESIDPVKEYGPTFVASAKQLAKQRKLTKELGVKLADVTKSLGHPVAAGGLTSVALARLPAEVKSNPKWKAADKALDVSFEKEHQMNLLMLRTFNRQMRDFMNKDRRSYMALFEARKVSNTEIKEEGGDIGRNALLMKDRLGKSSMQKKAAKRKEKLTLKTLEPIKTVSEEPEPYSAQKHEWGTPEGTKLYKDMTPGQGDIHAPEARALTRDELIKLNVLKSKIREDYDQPHEDDEPVGAKTKAKYAADNADAALDLPSNFEFSEVEILEMESEIDIMSFEDMINLGMYDDSELDVFDQIEDIEADVEADEEDNVSIAEVSLDEELSVQGRMKRRFHARRNRQKLKVARMRASRRAADPARIKKRAQRGALSVIKKRFARGRDIKSLPPAEKARLEKMVSHKFSGLVSRLAVRMVPLVRKNELNRIKKGGSMKSQASKKFKIKKGGNLNKYKAKKFKIVKSKAPKKKK